MFSLGSLRTTSHYSSPLVRPLFLFQLYDTFRRKTLFQELYAIFKVVLIGSSSSVSACLS
jgi:hypothetical protein